MGYMSEEIVPWRDIWRLWPWIMAPVVAEGNPEVESETKIDSMSHTWLLFSRFVLQYDLGQPKVDVQGV